VAQLENQAQLKQAMSRLNDRDGSATGQPLRHAIAQPNLGLPGAGRIV
jgi:hypothetical protein